MVEDIKLTSENELDFTGGDFVVDFSDAQHQQDIIAEDKGSYKQYPLLGVGITKYLNSAGAELILKRIMQLQLETDGYYVEKITFEKTDISEFTVEAERKI